MLAESLGKITGAIQSKTVKGLLEKYHLKDEAELGLIVERDRQFADMTVEQACDAGVKLLSTVVFPFRPDLQEQVRPVLYPEADDGSVLAVAGDVQRDTEGPRD